ncbi:type I 3-dehydroquinate dehydratase [Candidatus Micrarchaeota archaeon]|nr:type I 3-dehydroquinate dehydratase [Candidatus Micrarchaeota archaeon]
MICVSIGERTAKGCMKALQGLAFAEVRLDMMEPSELTEANVKMIFSQAASPVSQKAKLIATCRPGKLDENERKKLLGYAIASGAAYVDVEVEANDGYKAEIAAKARGKGCKVIVSYHNHKRTPPAEELKRIIEWCFESGADIAKIACMVQSEQDTARLLSLLDSDSRGRLVVVGMGQKGRLTRVVAPLLGSAFTYASSAGGKETAEGQISRETLEKMMEELKKLG